MPDAYVEVPPDSTGKKIDVNEVQTVAGTVERQRMEIPDTVEVGGDVLGQILVELRVISTVLTIAFQIQDELDDIRNMVEGAD